MRGDPRTAPEAASRAAARDAIFFSPKHTEGNTMATTSSKSADPKGRTRETDAIALLTADHKTVKGLFKEFEELTKQDDADEQKAELVQKICNELTVHAQVEEELFYPAVRDAIDDDDLMDEADIEHASAKDLIAQLAELEPGDDHYDARVTVLGEYVNHHVKEEEGEMFAKARKADVNTAELGEQIAERKEELKAELGVEDDDSAAAPRTHSESRKSGEKRK
jgi:hemerythrin superfamily protein